MRGKDQPVARRSVSVYFYVEGGANGPRLHTFSDKFAKTLRLWLPLKRTNAKFYGKSSFVENPNAPLSGSTAAQINATARFQVYVLSIATKRAFRERGGW